jgi:hypothetical protein
MNEPTKWDGNDLTEDIASGAYSNIPSVIYHSGPGVSKHDLDSVSISPAHYVASKETPSAPTEAMILGSLMHSVALEPSTMTSNLIAVIPEGLDMRTKEGKAWKAGASGKTIIHWEDSVRVREMCKALWKNRTVAAILGSGDVEVSMYTRAQSPGDPEIRILRRGRVDLSTEDASGVPMLADYKTCAYGGAGPEQFARSVERYRYHVQAEYYRQLYQHIYGETPIFVFIAQEKDPPYAVAIYSLGPEWMRPAQDTIERELALVNECSRSGVWHGYQKGENEVLVIDPPQWFIRHERERLSLPGSVG